MDLDSMATAFFSTILGKIVGFVLFIAASYLIVAYMYYTSPRCPKCNKVLWKKHLGKKLVEQKKCWGLVSRSAWTTTHRHASGTNSTFGYGTAAWVERVPVIRKVYALQYKCANCPHEWTVEQIEEVEDFDPQQPLQP